MAKTKEVTNKNIEKEVLSSVSTLISFIKSRVAADLVEGNKKLFELEEDQLRKVNYVVNASIDKSFSQGVNGVIKTVDSLKWKVLNTL